MMETPNDIKLIAGRIAWTAVLRNYFYKKRIFQALLPFCVHNLFRILEICM